MDASAGRPRATRASLARIFHQGRCFAALHEGNTCDRPETNLVSCKTARHLQHPWAGRLRTGSAGSFRASMRRCPHRSGAGSRTSSRGWAPASTASACTPWFAICPMTVRRRSNGPLEGRSGRRRRNLSCLNAGSSGRRIFGSETTAGAAHERFHGDRQAAATRASELFGAARSSSPWRCLSPACSPARRWTVTGPLSPSKAFDPPARGSASSPCGAAMGG